MSRSGYSDDCDGWELIRWRGAVQAGIRGVRGQRLLKDLLAALDAMPDKRLIANDLSRDGCYCALGVVGIARGLPIESIDPHDSRQVAEAFDISEALAKEIVFENDEGGWYANDTDAPEQRWVRVRAWVKSQIAKEPAHA